MPTTTAIDAGPLATLGAGRPSDGLAGRLGEFSLTDLLQTFELNRRSGTINLRTPAARARLWLREGRLVEASIDGGLSGAEAVYELVQWEEGDFSVDFQAVTVPQRIHEPISGLLLEAMRRQDELRRDLALPHAALVDPPPPPPPTLLAIHCAVMLLNVASSYAADHLERALVARRFEEERRALLTTTPLLASFRVDPSGPITWIEVDGEELPHPEATVRSTCAWLLRIAARLERALPGLFPLRRLRRITEAVGDDLEALGFYRELGLQPPDVPAAPGAEKEHYAR